jgi:hypothetical protein
MSEGDEFATDSDRPAQAGKWLLDAMQRLRDANVPPLTEEDVAEEVKAARKARRAQDANAVPDSTSMRMR